jgi:hypothetical protein
MGILFYQQDKSEVYIKRLKNLLPVQCRCTQQGIYRMPLTCVKDKNLYKMCYVADRTNITVTVAYVGSMVYLTRFTYKTAVLYVKHN